MFVAVEPIVFNDTSHTFLVVCGDKNLIPLW